MITTQKVTSNVLSRMFPFGLFSPLVYEDRTDSVFRNVGYNSTRRNTAQKKTYAIKNTAEV
jgi:hypothetical protein